MDLPMEVREEFQKIEDMHLFKFVEGIDMENIGFKYLNSLNQFKNEFIGLIQLQDFFSKRGSEMNLEQFATVLKSQKCPKMPKLFPPDFNIKLLAP
mmetsp:Transcript_4439/g.7563  ORF Transcript_4439/g.7563 Transcript_4439/m.7563 type:complete len:96 (-) Transcript_4439:43-330(-)